jgi:hypothetical protein
MLMTNAVDPPPFAGATTPPTHVAVHVPNGSDTIAVKRIDTYTYETTAKKA